MIFHYAYCRTSARAAIPIIVNSKNHFLNFFFSRSDPIDLDMPGCIDPGHMVGEDGKRYLFVGGIRRVRLTDGCARARAGRTA
jgi:hypothetical protein